MDLSTFDFRTGKMLMNKMNKNRQRMRYDCSNQAKVRPRCSGSFPFSVCCRTGRLPLRAMSAVAWKLGILWLMCEAAVVWDNDIPVTGCWTNTAIPWFFRGTDAVGECGGAAESSVRKGWGRAGVLLSVRLPSPAGSPPEPPVASWLLRPCSGSALRRDSVWGQREEQGWLEPHWYLSFGTDLRRGRISGRKLKRQEDGKASL